MKKQKNLACYPENNAVLKVNIYMKKIVDYKIIEANSHILLSQVVLQKMRQGYELQGGVSIGITTRNSGGVAYFYAQAIVKYED